MSTQELVSKYQKGQFGSHLWAVRHPVGLKIKFAGLMGRRSQLPLTRRVSLVHIFRGVSPDWSVGS